MKKTVKTICLLLVFALFALMAMGSGSSSSDDSSKSPAASSPEVKAAEKPKESAAPEVVSTPEPDAVTVEETEIFNQSGIKVTVKGYEEKSFYGPSLKLLIENDSAKDICVQSRNTSVNGYMVETMMSVDVAAGKKANDTLTLSQTDLKTAGITTVADIEFQLHIFDDNSWDTIVDSDPIQVKTSAAEGYEYVFEDMGSKAYSGNGVDIFVCGFAEEESWTGPAFVVYIVNSRTDGITVQARDVSINGFMVDPIFSCDVAGGKRAIDTISFMSSDLEGNDITTIETLELAFHIFELESWNTIVDTPPVQINIHYTIGG